MSTPSEPETDYERLRRQMQERYLHYGHTVEGELVVGGAEEEFGAKRYARVEVSDLLCDTCGRNDRMPTPGDYASMWHAGWRWPGGPEPPGTVRLVPRVYLFSCPVCPPVI
ncbi:hypothetical protein [Streptomyces nanshensis]|uniref:hypothetical protein n=1 Tax=Streptomyces nanshensis TaxID=518642 RepID=UPI00114CC7F4|nr:hypothetical protein [Streptomyces nanshensis]